MSTSSYRKVLNALAGTTGLGEAAAANALANTTGLEIVAALNDYNGTTGVEEEKALATARSLSTSTLVLEAKVNPNLILTGAGFEAGDPLEYSDYGTLDTFELVADSDGVYGTQALQIVPSPAEWFYIEFPIDTAVTTYGVPVAGNTLYTVGVSAKRTAYTDLEDDGWYFEAKRFDAAGDAITDFAETAAGGTGRDQAGDIHDGTAGETVSYLVNGELDTDTDPDEWNKYTFRVMTSPLTRFLMVTVGASSRTVGLDGDPQAAWRFDNLGVWLGTADGWRP